MGIGYDWHDAMGRQNRRLEQQRDIGARHATTLADLGYQERRSGLEDSEQARRLRDAGFGLERDQFGLESELSRGRLGMQGTFANALAQALGQRQSFGGNDVPPWMRQPMGQAQAQNGPGLDLREPTRNYLMRFLKG